MKTIYKYSLTLTDHQLVAMPQGAQPLSIQFQRGQLCLWALVDTNAEMKQVDFFIRGTGHEVDFKVNVPGMVSIGDPEQHFKFVGTVQAHGGALVWHVFTGRT